MHPKIRHLLLFDSMSSISRIRQLANSILSNTHAIDDYLEAEKLESPSFEIHAPSKLQLPAELASAKDQILDARACRFFD